MFKRITLLSPTLLSLAMSVDVKAQEATTINMPSSWGRAQVSAEGTTESIGIASGDAMIPLYTGTNGFFYGDAMVDYATDSTYLLSPGVGYRGLYNNQVLGAYFFDDYERTSLGTNFWVLSPGVEWISPEWDAHINAYFPTQSSEQSGNAAEASDFGIYDMQTYTTGSSIVSDAVLTPYAVIGNGVDGEVGYSFSQENGLRSRIYLGGYYYHPQESYDVSNVTGATIGFEKALNKNLQVSLMSSYDNLNHYLFGINFTASIGGESNEYSSQVNDRLFDPVERHIGILGTGAGAYDQQSLQQTGSDDYFVYFADPNGTGDGTYGNPGALTQSNLDTVYEESPDGARIYIQGGTEDSYTIDSDSADSTNGLQPYDNQDFYGRSADYMQPASTSERPDIEAASGYNAFFLRSGENSFSDLNISSAASGENTVGIYASNVGPNNETFTITNTTISQFGTGLSVSNSGSGTLTVNTNNAAFINNGYADFGSGVSLLNSSIGNLVFNADDSTFDNNTATDGSAFGLYAVNSSTGTLSITADQSTFDNNSSTGASYMSAGLYALNSNSGTVAINATDSTFNNNSAEYIASGLYLLNNASGSATLNASQAEFNSNQSTSDNGYAFGAYAGNSGAGEINATINQSTFDSNTTSGSHSTTAGFYANNISSGDIAVNVTGSTFNANSATGSASTAYGLNAANQNIGTMAITSNGSNFNNNSAETDGDSYAAGLNAANFGAGQLTVEAVSSQFNNNLGGGAGYGLYAYNADSSGNVMMSAINSTFNSNSSVGLGVDNESTDTSNVSLSVTNLSGSSFDNNGYGIYDYSTNGTSVTTINTSDIASATGNTYGPYGP